MVLVHSKKKRKKRKLSKERGAVSTPKCVIYHLLLAIFLCGVKTLWIFNCLGIGKEPYFTGMGMDPPVTKTMNRTRRTTAELFPKNNNNTCDQIHGVQAIPFVPEFPVGDNLKDAEWCLHHPAPIASDNVYLAAHLYARVYIEDKPKLSKLDIAHWLTYYRYAGFQRVYLYDCWQNEWERLGNYPPIQAAIKSGFVIYTNWHDVEVKYRGKDHVAYVEFPAKQHAIKAARDVTRWMSFTDMDEYVYIENDQEPGFMVRFLMDREAKGNGFSCPGAFLLPNIICEGGREMTSDKPMLIQQVPRAPVTEKSNQLSKPLARLDSIRDVNIHSVSPTGFQLVSPVGNDPNAPRMLHMWGGRRIPNWWTMEELKLHDRHKYDNMMNTTVPVNTSRVAERVLYCFTNDEMSSWSNMTQERSALYETWHGSSLNQKILPN